MKVLTFFAFVILFWIFIYSIVAFQPCKCNQPAKADAAIFCDLKPIEQLIYWD